MKTCKAATVCIEINHFFVKVCILLAIRQKEGASAQEYIHKGVGLLGWILSSSDSQARFWPPSGLGSGILGLPRVDSNLLDPPGLN